MINHSGNQFLSRYEYRLSRRLESAAAIDMDLI